MQLVKEDVNFVIVLDWLNEIANMLINDLLIC